MPSTVTRSSTSESASRAAADLAGSGLGAWLSGLCLLEPLIGVVWQRAHGGALGVEVKSSESALLALSLWLVYIADHWLDVREFSAREADTRGLRLPARSLELLSERHRFVLAQQPALRLLFGALLATALWIALRELSPAEWLAGCALLTLTASYLMIARIPRFALPKGPLVAVIFSCGLGVFIWPDVQSWSESSTWATLAFSALVLANIGVIAIRERETDARLGQATLPNRLPRLCHAFVPATLALCTCCALGAMTSDAWSAWYASVALSAFALAALHLTAPVLDADLHHRLADLALLLPAPLLWG